MATWRDFQLDLVQTVIFTPEYAAFNAAKVLTTILTKFSDRFDGEMQVLPLPSDAPADLSRVQLKSGDERRQLTISPSRMDSIWTKPEGNLNSVVAGCADVQEEYLRSTEARVGRIALVINRIFAVENPAQELIRRFCNEPCQREPFNHSKSFEIHNHKVYSPSGSTVDYSINSWVRCKTAELVTDKRQVILVQQDINTVETESYRFGSEQISSFFKMAISEVDGVLKKYFPE